MNQAIKPDRKLLLSHPVHFLSLGFGAGLMPRAPGTWGTLVAVPVYLALAQSLDHPGYLAACLLVVLAGIYFCGFTEKALGSHDHGSIVWDEIAGYLVTMIFVQTTWWSVLAGFLLFRLFDIWKPFPISWLDRNLKGGFGTMMDDVAAGILAWGSLQLLIWFYSA